ncbi:hypothetical protein LCGC14_2880540, partial [marine sediment metagenome]
MPDTVRPQTPKSPSIVILGDPDQPIITGRTYHAT